MINNNNTLSLQKGANTSSVINIQRHLLNVNTIKVVIKRAESVIAKHKNEKKYSHTKINKFQKNSYWHLHTIYNASTVTLNLQYSTDALRNINVFTY